MFDWQTVAAAILLLIASIYVGRRAWLRISSLSIRKRLNAPSCDDACGGCGTSKFVNLHSGAEFSNR
ncbi:MAG: hypothetical protein DMF73_12640 [Acidobacteria bacterium]|nr:MAG: hypothetical protein DMF73_12640 [Acidobacteriota bacterium]